MLCISAWICCPRVCASNIFTVFPLILRAASCRYAKSGNKDFATAVALWTLGDRGVLKVGGAAGCLQWWQCSVVQAAMLATSLCNCDVGVQWSVY
jgi:hypothetical protein